LIIFYTCTYSYISKNLYPKYVLTTWIIFSHMAKSVNIWDRWLSINFGFWTLFLLKYASIVDGCFETRTWKFKNLLYGQYTKSVKYEISSILLIIIDILQKSRPEDTHLSEIALNIALASTLTLMVSLEFHERNLRRFEDLKSSMEDILALFFHTLYIWTMAFLSPPSLSYVNFLVRFSLFS